MIAKLFRSVGWVAGVAVAASLLYFISLQVATERGRLEAVDRKIAATKRDIRQLQTEMGTRGSLRQLERWNGEVLSLSTPSANQFLPGEDAISGIDRGNLGVAGAAPPPVMAAVMAQDAALPKEGEVTAVTAAKPALSAQDKAVQSALAEPKRAVVQAVVVAESAPKGAKPLADVMKAARVEASAESKRKP